MISVKSIGGLFYLFNRDRDMRRCYTDKRVAAEVAKKENAKLNSFRRVA